MRLKAAVFAVFILSSILSARPLYAAQFSGDYLLSMCASDKDGRELVKGGHMTCQAYIAGVLDYHNLIRSLGTAPSVDFCIPDGIGLNTLQTQVASYLFKNKEQHGAFVASPAVALAMHTYYPCGKKKAK